MISSYPESQLASSKAQPSPAVLLAAIVDSSDDAIISKNLRSVVTSWNKGAERIFGYSKEEMVGQSIIRLLPPENLDEENVILSRLQSGERVDHFETVRMRKDGKIIHVSLTISPIRDETGIVIGASKIARDVTEQKVAAARLAEAHEQLKRADQMKAEFITTLSHELRTPLTAMSGWVHILKESQDPEDLSQGLEIIDRNIRAQTQLINDLLDMGRIESGKMSLDLQKLDLSSVVGPAVESLRPTAEVKNIRLTTAFASVNGMTMADKNRLQQVFWNLISNAIKFTPKGGRVHVTIERVNSHVEASVSDTGMGISREHLQAIFERFAQADASITRRHGGLGLGLAIAKNLVELHGGTILARSEGADQGSTFTVYLPVVASRAIDSPPEDRLSIALDAETKEMNLKGIKVLLVDDDADTLTTLCGILKRKGAEVRTAGSMQDGLEAFVKFNPQVIVSDIGMPMHDGYEFVQRVRALPGGRAVPAVALTALARAEDRTRALTAGFQIHIPKPADPMELIAVVRNLASLAAG